MQQICIHEELYAALYRALYVFSVAFDEHLTAVLPGSAIKIPGAVSKIWKTHALLAEELGGQTNRDVSPKSSSMVWIATISRVAHQLSSGLSIGALICLVAASSYRSIPDDHWPALLTQLVP